MKPTSLIKVLFVSALSALVLASAGMASAGRIAFLASGDKATVRQEGNSEADEPDEGGQSTPAKPAGSPAAREADCRAAAGLSADAQNGADSDGSQSEVKKGLDRAIEVVMANCIKNPQAPGLLNALRHLVANRDRHLAHQAEKGARLAARDAAKAARKAAHAKGHGSD